MSGASFRSVTYLYLKRSDHAITACTEGRWKREGEIFDSIVEVKSCHVQ